MKRRIGISVFVIWLIAGFSITSVVLAEEEGRAFTNRDLEQYSNPADTRPADNRKAATKSARRDETGRSADNGDQKKKEYWCRRGDSHRKKIEHAKEDIKEIEDSGSITKSLRKKLESAKKRLRAAEKDMADTDAEAYRKGIPAGWLRCQFE